MRALPRSLLAWIVALVLPLQGYAAAAMIACGPMHGASPAVAESRAAAQPPVDCERHAPAPAQPEKPAQGKCSACASCGTPPAVAAPAGLAFSVLAAAHSAAIPFVALTPETVVPDGLERPPRACLA
jgi:hypothetical protein